MKKKIGYKIREIRNSLGDSMEEFGKRFSPPASKGVVSNWENDYNYPNEKRLQKIAELGKTTTVDLLYGDVSDRFYSFLIDYINKNLNKKFEDKNSMFSKQFYSFSELKLEELEKIARDTSISMMWGKSHSDYSEKLEDNAIDLLHQRVISEIYRRYPTTNRMVDYVGSQVLRLLLNINNSYLDKKGEVLSGIDEKVYLDLQAPLRDVMIYISEYKDKNK